MDLGLLFASLLFVAALVWAFRRAPRWEHTGHPQRSVGAWTGAGGAHGGGHLGGGDFGGGGDGGGGC